MARTQPGATASKKRKPRKNKNKDLAQLLYMNSELTQAQIADKVGVNPGTVGRWARDGQWDLLRSANATTRKNQIRNHLLQLDELNRQIAGRPPGERYPTIQESDTISKLTKSIESLDKEASLSDYVTVFEGFFSFLRHAGKPDIERAISDLANEFIRMKAEQLR